MKRRESLTFLGGAGGVLLLVTNAQQPTNVARIGVLAGANPKASPLPRAFVMNCARLATSRSPTLSSNDGGQRVTSRWPTSE